jgi:hypothetical protein
MDGDDDGLIGNVIEANDKIDNIIKDYTKILNGKNRDVLEKLREEKGVVVF